MKFRDILETEGLSVSLKGISGNRMLVYVNGHEYMYEPSSISIGELSSKFSGMLKYSSGRALAWLKKNSTLVGGSKKTSRMEIK